MLSDMLWTGSFHCMMTSGGRIANPTRTIQADSEPTFATRPAAHTAEIQAPANVTFVYLTCILKMYEPSPNRAVPECTPVDTTMERSGACANVLRPAPSGNAESVRF